MCSVAIIVLLTLDVIFCVWYYAKEFHRISIDMASVGFAANWNGLTAFPSNHAHNFFVG